MARASSFRSRGAIELTFSTAVVDKALIALVRRVPAIAGRALKKEARIEMKESKKHVPRDTGDLQRSGRVSPVKKRPGVIEVQMRYGGVPAVQRGGEVDYALAVHEDARHAGFENPGGGIRGPKYLQRPLEEASMFMPDRIARSMQAEIEGKALPSIGVEAVDAVVEGNVA